jgi:hypothetical protein
MSAPNANRIFLAVMLLIMFTLVVIIGIILTSKQAEQISVAQTAESVLKTNTHVQAYATQQCLRCWTKTPPPIPQRTQTAAMATHHADNTRAYATATALARSTAAR